MNARSLVFASLALTVPFAVSAGALNAISDNYYSMLKVDTQSKETALAVPFVAIEAATNQHPISVSEAVDTRTLEAGDMLLIYDRENDQYNTYQLSMNGSWETAVNGSLEAEENSGWEAVPTVMITSEGEAEQNVGEAASVMKVDPGYGSWLIRKNTTNPVILHGQLPYSATVEVHGGKNLIGMPTLAPVDFNDCGINWTECGVLQTTNRVDNSNLYVLGDSIMFTPHGSNVSRLLYYVQLEVDAAPRWQSLGRYVNPILPIGCACWLIHHGEDFTYGTNTLEDESQAGGQEPEPEQEEGGAQ